MKRGMHMKIIEEPSLLTDIAINYECRIDKNGEKKSHALKKIWVTDYIIKIKSSSLNRQRKMN